MNDANAAGARVERLLAQFRSGPDPRAAALAEELVRCLVQLYGAGLARVVDLVGPAATRDLCADPLVESLLLVHDLHPLDADARIRRALHGTDVEYLGIDGHGVAHVRVTGGGCGSAVGAVEAAVVAAAPEVAGVAVERAAPLLQITRRPS